MVVDPADRAQQRIGEIASQHRADLRDSARRSKPVEPGGQRLLKVGGIACKPPASPRSRRRRVTSSTNSGTPPVRSLTLSTTFLESALRGAISSTICRTCALSRGPSEITLW